MHSLNVRLLSPPLLLLPTVALFGGACLGDCWRRRRSTRYAFVLVLLVVLVCHTQYIIPLEKK